MTSKVVYVRRTGGPKRHATACAPRPARSGASLRTSLLKLRAASLQFAGPRTLRALRSKGAKRVLAVDGVTDAALAAHVMPVVRAATVTHVSGTNPIPGPEGTGTILRYSGTDWDSSELHVGQETDVTTETTGTRVKQSAKKTKRIKLKYLMDRCPDARGVAHGTLDMTLRETSVVGGVTLTETNTFDGTIDAHFADNARIASVDVAGSWSFTTAGGASRRSVSGTLAASGFSQAERSGFFSNYLNLTTAVTTGTDDGIATSGRYLGSWVTILPTLTIEENMLDPLQKRALGGACVQIVTNADKLHVLPGGTVAIVAHLTDSDGIATFAGPITAYNAAHRVTPTTAHANTDTTFTYSAPAGAHAGDTDTVQLSHISRRGKARDGTVTVIVDKSVYPARFDGTWTSIFTTPNGSQGWTETVHGTATYVRDLASPHAEAGQSYVDYTVQSASVDWTVSGSFDPGGGCTINFTGSGTPQATGDIPVASQLTLEDVRNSPFAPASESQPYYYSIAATGDGANPPPYDITHTPAGCVPNSQGATAVDYLAIGSPRNYGPDVPPDQIQKTGVASQLQGHYVGNDATALFHVDSTWTFTGSG